jgi:hypothetical protein
MITGENCVDQIIYEYRDKLEITGKTGSRALTVFSLDFFVVFLCPCNRCRDSICIYDGGHYLELDTPYIWVIKSNTLSPFRTSHRLTIPPSTNNV